MTLRTEGAFLGSGQSPPLGARCSTLDDELSAASSHRKQEPTLAFKYRLYRSVDGDLLVIALAFSDSVIVGGSGVKPCVGWIPCGCCNGLVN